MPLTKSQENTLRKLVRRREPCVRCEVKLGKEEFMYCRKCIRELSKGDSQYGEEK
jgi:ribosomal protein S14